MEFISARPDVVRSIRQIEFLRYWLRLRIQADGRTPRMHDFQPERIDEERSDLVTYQIDWAESVPRIIIASSGARVAEAYGRANERNAGLALGDFIGADAVPTVVPVYHACIDRRLPIYTITNFVDNEFHPVVYERLLLPFADRDVITHIVGSLKTISEDGRFQLKNLFVADGNGFPAPTCFVIDQYSAARVRSGRGDDSGIMEAGSRAENC